MLPDYYSEGEDNEENGNGNGDENPSHPALLDQPLYEGSPLLLRSLLREYLTIFTHQSTSKQVLSNFLAVTSFAFPQPNLLPVTFGQVSSLIQKETLTIYKSHICVRECLILKGDDVACSKCGEARFKPADSIGRLMPRRMFSHTSIGDALELAFGCRNIAQVIQSAGGCEPRNIITDIKDTLFWRDHQNSGLKIVLGFNTDGVNPFHSTANKYSFWPLIFTIMNLPKYIRNKSNALILYGIVPSKSKAAGTQGIEPDLHLYQEMMVDELLELSSREIYSVYTGAPLPVKIEVLLYMMDFQGNL